jgi:predicted ATPase
MRDCRCNVEHARRRVVVTGGPGAGKTAVLELARRVLCRHVVVLPESAGILFGGGFPRAHSAATARAAQRAIFHVQHELEAVADAGDAPIVLCDRGTVDGAAYWPGEDGSDLFADVGTTRAREHARYDAVIHMRTPPLHDGYDHSNPLRIEAPAEALAIDARIEAAWNGHPRRVVVEATHDFFRKASRGLELVLAEIPPCCRDGALDPLEAVRRSGSGGT